MNGTDRDWQVEFIFIVYVPVLLFKRKSLFSFAKEQSVDQNGDGDGHHSEEHCEPAPIRGG